MSLYEDLGLPADASQEAIRKAYRKKVKETHPDAEGGSPAAFEKVARAHMVLIDPDKRKRYDETGYADDNAKSFEDSRVHQILGEVIQGVLAGQMDLDHQDPLKEAMNLLSQKVAQCDQATGQVDTAIKRADKFRTRLKKKKDTDDFLIKMLDAQVAALNQQKGKIKDEADSLNKAIGILKGHTYRTDMQPTSNYGAYSDLKGMLAEQTRKYNQSWLRY